MRLVSAGAVGRPPLPREYGKNGGLR